MHILKHMIRISSVFCTTGKLFCSRKQSRLLSFPFVSNGQSALQIFSAANQWRKCVSLFCVCSGCFWRLCRGESLMPWVHVKQPYWRYEIWINLIHGETIAWSCLWSIMLLDILRCEFGKLAFVLFWCFIRFQCGLVIGLQNANDASFAGSGKYEFLLRRLVSILLNGP